MHSNLVTLLTLACLALAAIGEAAQAPAPPQPAALAKKALHQARSSKTNPFTHRQATRKQIIQRQFSQSSTLQEREVEADTGLGKLRITERDTPSPSPNAGDVPGGPQFYLEYCGSGTGADSQFAAIKMSEDGSDTYLVPVLDKGDASLFSLNNGQLVSGSTTADLSSDIDILSFDSSAVIQQNSYSIPSFTSEGNKLVAQGQNIAFNVCSSYTYAAGSSQVDNNILHLSSPNSIGSGCSSVTMSMLYI